MEMFTTNPITSETFYHGFNDNTIKKEVVKNYKENTIYVGSSDCARLLLFFESHQEVLKMGEDGRYTAHVITDLDLVPDHYKLVADGYTYLEIIDDEGPVIRLYGEKILVYRAGLRGILIATVTLNEWNAKGRT